MGRPSARRGVALLAALAMLALSAALLAGSFAAARATTRSARTAGITARVETGTRRAFGELLSGWDASLDSLVVGGAAEPVLGADTGATPPLVRRARVLRIDDRLFVVTVDVRAFARDRPVAQRRARLLLERPAADTAPASRPVPIRRWSLEDLY